jgi:predicted oxidoreductase
VAGVLLVLVAGGATAGVLVKQHQDDVARKERIAEQRAADAREAAAEAARRAAAARRARERAAHRLEVAIRRSLVRSLQRSVTRDAIGAVNDGLLEGPILRTECTPVGGGNLDDTAQHTGNFSCLAVSTVNGDGTMSGYGYSATVNYDDGSYTWHLGN